MSGKEQEKAVFELDAYKTMRQAERGDPGALRKILQILAEHLRGERSLPRPYAGYCAECLERFVESDVMKDAADDYKALVAKFVKEEYFQDAKTPEEVKRAAMSAWSASSRGEGPRIPQEHPRESPDAWSQKLSLGRIGRAFNKAFNLSGSQRRDRESLKQAGRLDDFLYLSGSRAHVLRSLGSQEVDLFKPQAGSDGCPEYLREFADLLYVGESQTHAIKIIRSGVENPLSERQIARWIRRKGIHRDRLDPREIDRRRKNLGFMVEYLIECGLEPETAFEEVGTRFVQGVLGFEDATVFLKPTTVKKAYELIRS